MLHEFTSASQFVIALNIIEDFLSGEGLKYLRLVRLSMLKIFSPHLYSIKDGHTKGSERQKGMDEFNKPGSDVFVYLLTTRAGVCSTVHIVISNVLISFCRA